MRDGPRAERPQPALRRAAAGTTGAAAPTGGAAQRARLSLAADDGERRPDREPSFPARQEALDHAAREDLDLDVGLVGLDDGDDVAALDLVTRAPSASGSACPAPMSAPRIGIVNSHISRASPGPPATIASARGSAASSRCLAYGIGTSALQTRCTGQSSRSKPCSMTCAETSAARPHVRQDSSTSTARWVFASEASTVSTSSGPQRAQVDHLGGDPLLGERSPPSSALPTEAPQATIVASVPSRRTAAWSRSAGPAASSTSPSRA